MKNLIILLFVASLFAGCDKVPSRIPPPIPDCILNQPIVHTNTLTSGSRKVLIDDFTGHTCGNCPRAAEIAEKLVENNNGNVIVIASHVSSTFARPRAPGYPEDFRDQTGTEWDVFLGMSAASLPKGTVNRMLISGQYPQERSTWTGHVATELARPQSVKLDVTTTYDPKQKLLNVKVFSTFKADYSANVNVIMVLTQDSIIASQTDYTPPAGVEVVDGDRRPNYRFDHMMVKSLNGTWGQSLKTAPIAKNDTVTITKDCNLVTKCFLTDQLCVNDDHLYLVVMASNETTKEVLQVERVKIK